MVKHIAKLDEIKHKGKSYKTMLPQDLAETMLVPEKVSNMQNSFQAYKMRG